MKTIFECPECGQPCESTADRLKHFFHTCENCKEELNVEVPEYVEATEVTIVEVKK